jgi:DNA-binding winged helix-turn-helix (wHTH) protein
LLYLFKDYALDTDRRELRRGDDLVPVEPKVFDLLVHLVGRRDCVVSKEDLV